MPTAMQQLGLVFLVCRFFFFNVVTVPAVAQHIYQASARHFLYPVCPAMRLMGGAYCFSVYNGISAIYALFLPVLAR